MSLKRESGSDFASSNSKRSRYHPAKGTLRVVPCYHCVLRMQAIGPQWACRGRGVWPSGTCAECSLHGFNCYEMVPSAVPAAIAAQAAAVAAISKAHARDDTSLFVPAPDGWGALIFDAKNEHVKARRAMRASISAAPNDGPVDALAAPVPSASAASTTDVAEIKEALSELLAETVAIRRQREALVEGLQLICERLLRDE